MKKINKKLLAGLFIVIALGAIFVAFFPIAKSYYYTYPPLGDDFYHTFSQIQYFKNNLTWPQLSWKYIWWFGGPSLLDYPWLNFYLITPLVKFLGLYQGVIFYYLAAILFYGWTCYFLFKKLSSSRLIALGLAAAVIWSTSTWILLIKSAFAAATNQLFLALAVLLILKYQESNKRKFLYLSAMTVGLSFFIHGISIAFLLPALLILITFWWDKKERFWRWKKKIVDIFSFAIIVVLISSYYFYNLLFGFGPRRFDFSVLGWMKQDAFSAILNKTDIIIPVLFIGLFLFALLLKRFKEIKKIVPFFAVLLYIILFNIITLNGHNPVGTDFPPHKGWFIYTLVVALFCAILWQAVEPKLKIYFRKWLFTMIQITLFLALISPLGLFSVFNYLDYFKVHNEEYSCAPAESLHKAIIKNDYIEMDKNFPDWFPRNDKNWRYYPLNSCLYLWWNVVNKMPISRGYSLLLINKMNIDYSNRMSELFTGVLAKKNPNLDPAIVKNSFLYFLDWMGLGYIENYDSPYIKDPEIVELDKKPEAFQVLPIKKEVTSPIIKATNVPSILVVASPAGFDTVIQALAQENLNSRYLIPIKGTSYIDDLTKEDLNNFKAILLYDYHYRKEKSFHQYPLAPWNKLSEYVKNGGNLIIETGSEVKESDLKNLPGASKLPEVFPIEKTSWGELGSSWQPLSGQDSLLRGVNLKNLPPLIYNEDPWKLSYSSKDGVRNWAKAILSQKGNPVLVEGEFGRGKVVWSGLTLPYHIQTYSDLEENQLFRNILSELLVLKDEQTLPFEFERDKSEHIVLRVDKARGVLFKENYNTGWQARVNGQKLKIYKTALGFMYVKFPENLDNAAVTIDFDYKGQPLLKDLFYLNLATILWVIVYFLGGYKLNKKLEKWFRFNKLRLKVKKWWANEEIE